MTCFKFHSSLISFLYGYFQFPRIELQSAFEVNRPLLVYLRTRVCNFLSPYPIIVFRIIVDRGKDHTRVKLSPTIVNKDFSNLLQLFENKMDIFVKIIMNFIGDILLWYLMGTNQTCFKSLFFISMAEKIESRWSCRNKSRHSPILFDMS